MAATMRWNEYNGASATETQGITNLNFGSVDQPNLDYTLYTIRRGEASFDKWIKIDFYSGTFNKVSNFKFWRSDGGTGDGPALPTGITIVGEAGSTADLTYTQPSQTALALSAVPNSEATALTVGPSAGLTTYGLTYYIHLQMQTDTTASPGDVGPIYFTFAWDEE